MPADDALRPGELAAEIDPATFANDANLIFIGHIISPWKTRDDCPKNVRAAREMGETAAVTVDPEWRPGLAGLKNGDKIILLYWMHHARRDILVQAPRHSRDPRGVFSLRSPVRPNSISMATVLLIDIDHRRGRLVIDAIDCVDGTPLLDIKPWIASVDD